MFQCVCGRKYRTGATEWDHLGDWEHQNRVSQIIGLGILFSAMASVFGFLVYLPLHFALGLREGAVVTAVIITALPFVLMQVSFWPLVVMSMWRTRFAKSIEYGKK